MQIKLASTFSLECIVFRSNNFPPLLVFNIKRFFTITNSLKLFIKNKKGKARPYEWFKLYLLITSFTARPVRLSAYEKGRGF